MNSISRVAAGATVIVFLLFITMGCWSATGGNGGDGRDDTRVDDGPDTAGDDIVSDMPDTDDDAAPDSTPDAVPDTPDTTEDPEEETTGPGDYPAGMPNVEGTWTGCEEIPPEGEEVTAYIELEDFQENFPVEGATIDVFLGNIVTGEPDFELGPTDPNGRTEEFNAPANAQFAYRVNGSSDVPFPPGEIKTSIEYGVVIPAEGGTVTGIAVSRHTYLLIPTVLGYSPSPTMGILVGNFTDCDDDEVEGIVARLYPSGDSEACNDEEAVLCVDRYFVVETPARDQPWSSADGLYIILEVRPGEGYTLELHGKVSGSSCEEGIEILGAMSDIRIIDNAINIVDVSAGAAEAHDCAL